MTLLSAHRNTLAAATLTSTGVQPLRRGLAASLVGLALICSSMSQAAESDIRGPDITIIVEEDKTIHEFRQGGQLRMVRVVPKWGKPYYLVPADQTTGFGDLERADKLIPSWVIVEF